MSSIDRVPTDPVSERLVVGGYRSMMRGRGALLITHRRELAMEADRVVVIDQSRCSSRRLVGS